MRIIAAILRMPRDIARGCGAAPYICAAGREVHFGSQAATLGHGARSYFTRGILESVQAAGLHAPYACRGGVCTTCRAKVLKGEVTMLKNYGLTDDEVAQGYVLTCQAVPESDEIVLSYDE